MDIATRLLARLSRGSARTPAVSARFRRISPRQIAIAPLFSGRAPCLSRLERTPLPRLAVQRRGFGIVGPRQRSYARLVSIPAFQRTEFPGFQEPSSPVFWNPSFPVIQISGAASQPPGFHDAHRDDSWVGSQLNTSRLLRMNASFCSAFIRPWYLRKKPLSPAHFASLPGVDSRGRSLSA